eukprot:gene5149-15361_t
MFHGMHGQSNMFHGMHGQSNMFHGMQASGIAAATTNELALRLWRLGTQPNSSKCPAQGPAQRKNQALDLKPVWLRRDVYHPDRGALRMLEDFPPEAQYLDLSFLDMDENDWAAAVTVMSDHPSLTSVDLRQTAI